MPIPEPFRIPIKTLTPIWTGNAEIKTKYLKATSFLGGLRFWTEALLRSFGCNVCNITGDGERCVFDSDNHGASPICEACQIFGCTGKGRRFALQIRDAAPSQITPKPISQEIISIVFVEGRRPSRWFTPKDEGLSGSFSLIIEPAGPEWTESEEIQRLALALTLMLQWGTLGARDQYGNGYIKVDLPSNLKEAASRGLAGFGSPKDPDGLSLRDFFFYRGEAKTDSRETPFRVRYDVRNDLRNGPSDKLLRHFFGGTITGGETKQASKYNIGLLPGGILQGWGWFPKNHSEFAPSRDRCLNVLKTRLQEYSKQDTLKWIEFQSKRDTQHQNQDWPGFVSMLFKGGW